MTESDISLGMRLKEQAGWNQVESDWRRALELQPDGCFVAELDGTPVGTTTNCILGEVAWIAMVLVDAGVRKRGVGKALLQHSLDFLDQRGVPGVRLDATPLGRPLYEKLGFTVEYPLTRHIGTLPATADGPITLEPSLASAGDLPEIIALDREVTGTDRGKLLRWLFAFKPDVLSVIRRNGLVAGYSYLRYRAKGIQLGPCLGDAEAAAVLLGDYRHRFAGQYVFADIPDANTEAARWAISVGLAAQRPLFRMCRGSKPRDEVSRMWFCFGPEKG